MMTIALRRLMSTTAVALALTASSAIAQEAPAPISAPIPAVAATTQTEASASGAVAAGIVVLDGETARFVGATALGGLEVYGLDGKRLGATPSGEVAGLDVAYGYDVAGKPTTVIAAVDTTLNALRLFTMDGATLTEAGARPVPLGFAAENVCLFHNSLDGALYAFVVGDGGEIDQQLIYTDADGKLDARQARRLNVISTVKQCAADSQAGVIYASEESVGIWRIDANPEAFAAPALIDGPRLGRIAEETGGLALYDGGDEARWLIASDPKGGRINLYDRDRDDAYVGSLTLTGPSSGMAAGAAIEEPGPMAAISQPVEGFPHGLVMVTDEGGQNLKAVSFADIAGALSLPVGAPVDPRVRSDAPLPVVMATVESLPVSSFGDAADDPAIWAHPTDPAQSLVIGTDKKGGLLVYDMQGRVVQDLRDGKMNNVDLRGGFKLGDQTVTLVTASNRTDQSIAIYRLDPATRTLTDVADGAQPTELADPYGLCMFQNPTTGRTYVFINGDDTRLRQWELVDAGNGKVKTRFVREMTFDSQTEGCAADDATDTLYVDEEDVALWRMPAEAAGAAAMTVVQRVTENPALKDDLEGVGLYDLGDGRGYIVVSSQGNDTYAVYRREAPQDYLGSFAVAANAQAGIDGISETDGLEITSRNLGPGFEHGAMVAQDGRNVLPVENQNFKYVPWTAIAQALKLDVRPLD